MKKKYKIATLGCRTNQYESEGYATQLRARGFTEAVDGEKADICIVNTCTVTASADSHSRHQIRQLSKENPEAELVVTGCLAEKLSSMKEVTRVVLNKDKENLLTRVFPEENFPEFAIDTFAGHTRAFVKVQDGCNSFCSYCIIPYVRGRSRSRKIPDILKEVKTLIAEGYREVVLTGINIGDFEGENGERLADLVTLVDNIEGLDRLRLSSIDPDEVDDALTKAILEGKKTCPSMHIVLQSGSNSILKRMNRKYTRQMFIEATQKLIAARPDFTFTTDVIVGFPGETEADFEESLQILRDVQFAKVHMFPYSVRERTKAALFPNQISREMIQERKQKVLRASERAAFLLREKYVGRTLDVLVESEDPVQGHTENFLTVLLEEGTAKKNEIISVVCEKNSPKGLQGKRVS